MSSINTISVDKLTRLIGTAHCPVLVDVRTEDDFNANPRLIPSSMRRSHADPSDWAQEFAGRSAIAICQRGAKLSQGVAAWLRHAGVPADALEDGFEGWRKANLPLVPAAKMPPLDKQGRTVWVTRARPKIDRVACPWLIRRFIDPNAEFIYVPKDQVLAVAQQTGGIPYDIDGVEFTHEGERCSFDTILRIYEIKDPALDHLATIVRGADTSRHDLSPQCGGLFAISLGLSANFPDDHEMLKHGMVIYDALYTWCRSLQAETHNWPARTVGA
jgi:rhodanese-related sulfurtransferase